MESQEYIQAIQAENVALRKTVKALIHRVDGLLNSSPSQYDTFSQSVTLQQIVNRRTQELKQITENAQQEASRRRKAEEIMRSERRLLSSVLSHIPYLVAWKDMSCAFLGCNLAFRTNAGLTTDQVITGLREEDLDWEPSNPSLSLERERHVIDAGKPIIDSEESFHTADGQTRAYLVSTVPMRDDNGKLSGTLSIFADITERKQLEAQLLHAQKLESIGQLAAGIAHEINTPAQYVSDNTHFIQTEFGNIMHILELYHSMLSHETPERDWVERQREMNSALESIEYDFLKLEIPNALKQSVEGIERITHIIRAMKDFSHPGSTQREDANLNQAIESTVTVCSNRWKYVCNIELNLDPNLPPVPCLLSEFNQVILNIIVNAADAIESRFGGSNTKGLITISTKQIGSTVMVEVTDNGGGIPEEIQHKIFDPFFTTKDVGKGTGQGLAISRDIIVQKHGGKIECDVESGERTTFRITLPISAPESHSAAA